MAEPVPVTPTPDPIAEAIQTVKPLEMPSLSGLGGISGFDVTSKSVDNMLSEAETNKNILNPLISDINKFNVGAGQAGLINKNTADALKEYVGTDEFSSIVDQYSQARIGEQTGSWEGAASREVLNSLGIPHSFETQDEFGRTSVYNFDEQTNDFELVHEYGGTSKENEIIKAVAETAVTAMVTAGMGSAISSGFGVSSTTGQAIAAGAVSAAQGDDLDEVIISAATAGLAEEVKAAEAAASLAEATKEAAAYADTMNQIKSGIDIVKAIDNKDIIGAISSGMELAGIDSLVDYTEDIIANSLGETAGMGVDGALTDWAFYNSDHLAEATVKFADSLIREGDLGEATQDAVVKYIKDGGGIEDLVAGAGDFSLDLEVPEVVQQVGQAIANGASAINRNLIKPAIGVVETVGEGALAAADEAIRALPTEIEDWKEAEDYVKQQLREFDEYVLQPVVNPIKEELANFDDEKLQPIKEDIEKVIKDVDQALSDANKYTREELAEFDKNTLQPIKNDLEKLIEGMSTDLGGMGDMLSGLWDAITGVGEGLAATQERVSRPSADDSPLVKMRTQYGEQYEFEDLRNNPLLNNEFLS